MKNTKLNEILLSMTEGLDDYLQLAIKPNKFWYWEYYKSIEEDIKDTQKRRDIYQQIYHLEKSGHFNKNGFSSKGFLKVLKAKLWFSNNEKKWDKKWRIVIFDIPEKKRNLRGHFRDSLKNIGFKILQNSIWISPYGDFEDIKTLAKHYKVEKYVVLIYADKISNDILFKMKFNL